jgi:hypothetical protein
MRHSLVSILVRGLVVTVSVAAVAGFVMVVGWALSGSGIWYLGHHLGVKLVPSLLVFAVTAVAVAVLLRQWLARRGWVRDEDRWQDWRTEPLEAPVVSEPECSQTADSPGEGARWDRRGTIRSRRYERAKRHWAYLRD